MSVAKSIEVISSSTVGIEDAVRSGIAKVAATVNGIQGAWGKSTKVVVKGNEIAEWRVALKITFVVD